MGSKKTLRLLEFKESGVCNVCPLKGDMRGMSSLTISLQCSFPAVEMLPFGLVLIIALGSACEMLLLR